MGQVPPGLARGALKGRRARAHEPRPAHPDLRKGQVLAAYACSLRRAAYAIGLPQSRERGAPARRQARRQAAGASRGKGPRTGQTDLTVVLPEMKAAVITYSFYC
jgi:hypothetical protein